MLDVIVLNKWGYFSLNWSSRSNVYSGPRFEFHRTLTIGIRSCLRSSTSRFITSTGSSTNRSCPSTWISSRGTTSVSSDRHFFEFGTWKTLCTPLSSSGRLRRYATGPIRCVISKVQHTVDWVFPVSGSESPLSKVRTFKSIRSPTQTLVAFGVFRSSFSDDRGLLQCDFWFVRFSLWSHVPVRDQWDGYHPPLPNK